MNFCSLLQAQEERRVSLSIYGGAAFFPKDKKTNANLPTRALGGFNPSPLVGLGAYFKLTKRFYIGENYMYLFTTKEDNRKLSAHTFRTTLKYYLLTDKKINPYLTGSFNINMVNLDRKAKDYDFVPDPSNNTNVIGAGIAVNLINYREKALKLSGLPVLGGTIGAGFDFKITKKLNVFAEYNLQANFGKGNALIEKYYFSNQSNFVFHTITAGVNMKLFKPQKQLLATLSRDDWRNSRSIDVKGTIIYKKPDKPYKKILPVEKTDTLENVLEIDPTDANGVVFFSKNIEFGDYQFMLAKRKRRIIRADLQILNYNRIEIEDDELELDMVEDEGSENILSRDANFAVLLREGFQHDVELTTTAENIMGKYTPVDSNCRVRIILKDQYDSIISYVDTLENNAFNFVDVAPGNYKLVFQRLNNDCKKTEFKYSFTGSTPYVRSQSNTNEPEDTVASYSINGNVSTSETKPDAPKGTTVKLIDPSGRVESSTSLAGAKTNFNYKGLRSPNYNAIFEDPTNKASMNYKVKDKQSNVIRQVKSVPSKKVAVSTIAVAGKIELPNPEQSKNITVLLVDSTGKIKQKAPLKSNGTFSFDNLAKNKYKVVYESTDPLVRGKLNYNTIDKSIKINKIVLPELSASIEEVDTVHFYKKGSIVRDTTKSPVTTITPVVKKTGKTKEVPIRYPYMQFKPGTTYNDLGYEVQPEGYGVQVSSFFINSNLEKFCQRLRSKGEKNIFIQVIQKDKNNPEAGIIYRVVIGADKDKEKMLKKVPTYMDKGYDAVLRKHLDVVTPQ